MSEGSALDQSEFVFLHLFSSPLLKLNGKPSKQLKLIEEGDSFKAVIKASKRNISFKSAKATTSEIQFGGSSAKIVHFSGHGDKELGMVFEYPLKPYSDKLGKYCMVTTDDVQRLNRHFKPQLVFVSACYSKEVALGFHDLGVDHIIAIKRDETIDDSVVQEFGVRFYDALLRGWTVLESFTAARKEVERYVPKEQNKIILLPDHVNHDVAIDLPPCGDCMLDKSAEIPRGNLQIVGSHVGREAYVAYVYNLLHIDRDENTVIVITGSPTIGKSSVALRTLNYSCERREFGGYVVLKGTDYANTDPSQFARLLIRDLVRLMGNQDPDLSGDFMSMNTSNLLDKFQGPSSMVVLLHKFDVKSPVFGEVVNCLVATRSCKVKVIITAPTPPVSIDFPRMDILEINKFTDSDALKLYLKHAPEASSPNVSQYEGMPLAIIRGAKGIKTLKQQYQYCVVLCLSPYQTLSQISRNAHEEGYSYPKQYLVNQLIHDVFTPHRISASICSTPNNQELLREGIFESKYLVYVGVGVGVDVAQFSRSIYNQPMQSADSSIPSSEPPRIVIVCLQHGAQHFSEMLANENTNLSAVFWINADINDGVVLFKLSGFLSSLLHLKTFADINEQLETCFSGVDVGFALGEESFKTPLSSITSVGNGVITIKPKLHHYLPLNNVLSRRGLPFSYSDQCMLSKKIAAIDAQVFCQVCDNVESGTKVIAICHSDVNRVDRHRSVALEVVKAYLSVPSMYVAFQAVVVIDSIETLLEFKHCFDKREFSHFFSASDKVYLTGKVLLWVDLPNFNDVVSDIIKKIVKDHQNYSVLLTLADIASDSHHILQQKLDVVSVVHLDGSSSNDFRINAFELQQDLCLDISKANTQVEFILNDACSWLEELLDHGMEVLDMYQTSYESFVVIVSFMRAGALQQLVSWLDKFHTSNTSSGSSSLSSASLETNNQHFIHRLKNGIEVSIIGSSLSEEANDKSLDNHSNKQAVTSLKVVDERAAESSAVSLPSTRLSEQEQALVDMGFPPSLVAAAVLLFGDMSEAVVWCLGEQDKAECPASSRENMMPTVSLPAYLDETSAVGQAAYQGDLDGVKELIRRNPRLLGKATDRGHVPLHYAASGGDLLVIEYLLSKGANVNKTCKRGQSSLHFAARGGHVAAIECLLDAGANCYQSYGDNMEPIHLAAEGGHVDAIDCLFMNGTKFDCYTRDGYEPIHFAARGGHVDAIKHLIQLGASAKDETWHSEMPLHLAARGGNIDAMHYLIEELGVNYDQKNKYKMTALAFAAEGGHVDAMKYLIDLGSATNQSNNWNQGLFHHAATGGHVSAMEYLTELQVSHDESDRDGRKPIHKAAQNGHIDAVKYLVSIGANYSEKAKYGGTPLELAQREKHRDVIKYLIGVQRGQSIPEVQSGV